MGDFVDDQMHGNGTFTFPDGSEFIGRFANGHQHGVGMIKLADGTEAVGLWEHGEQLEIEFNIDLDDTGSTNEEESN